jgi:dihydrofolate synthase/folylpolyglutamate synthase
MIESVLRTAGFRTGLYTSPHLHDYTERIRINGEPISHVEFARLVTGLRAAVERVRDKIGERSFVTFDLLTALGFLAFRDAGVEAQVIEVGLGGRVDSTNVFDKKEVAVITPISLEHTAVLGDSVEAIAREKAGIITPGCSVVIGVQEYPEAKEVIRAAAGRAGATVISVAKDYSWEVVSRDRHGQRVRVSGPSREITFNIHLAGAHQAANAATAIAAVDALRPRLPRVTLDAIVRGLSEARWPGRCEVLQEAPLVIADGAHNRDSARALRETLVNYFDTERVTFIIGSSSDKDIVGLAEELASIAERVIATKTGHPRAMDPKRIQQAFAKLGVDAEDVDSVGVAMEQAMAATGRTGVICLAGSLFVAAEGREWFGLR